MLRVGGGVVVALDGAGIDEGLLVASGDAGVGLLHVLGVALDVVADDGGALDGAGRPHRQWLPGIRVQLAGMKCLAATSTVQPELRPVAVGVEPSREWGRFLPLSPCG